jgi:hypothetical protein
MRRETINRICGVVPLVLSGLAFLLAIAAVMTGFEKGQADEGAAAHIFQLLIVAQLPLALAYFATADWGRWKRAIGPVALQAGALLLAFAPVAYFKL